jgi:predicted transcriptional regulator
MRYCSKHLFQMDAEIFFNNLTAHQLAVYSYLVFCSGSRNACQMNVRTIAAACGCSESSVRRALHGLREREFIDVKGAVQKLRSGGYRRTCNCYYLLDRSEWKPPGGALCSSK